MRDAFLQDIASHYMAGRPPDAQGRVHVSATHADLAGVERAEDEQPGRTQRCSRGAQSLASVTLASGVDLGSRRMRTPCTTPRSRWRLSDFMTDTEHPRAIRSFVTRAGRITEAQARALEVLWPKYGVEFAAARLDCDALFGRHAPRTVEIGFGNGDNLAKMAAAHPERDYLGIEVHRPGVGRLTAGARGRPSHQCPRHLPRRGRGVGATDPPTVSRRGCDSLSRPVAQKAASQTPPGPRRLCRVGHRAVTPGGRVAHGD